MLGAIIGDIVGSRFEFANIKSKDFPLFDGSCFFTDDSVMTLAVAKGIISAGMTKTSLAEYRKLLEAKVINSMQTIGRRYPNCGYGNRFYHWVFSNHPRPYNSFGNGAAMRISPVGEFARTEAEVVALSQAVTSVSHNHPEGLKGAEATAMAIFLARKKASKEEIRKRIEKDYYNLDFTLSEIRENYRFDETCQGTVPQAIKAFLEAASFEDAIRNAVSLGGDSDTLAAICGSIAGTYYGIPEEIKNTALSYLDEHLRGIYQEWQDFIKVNVDCNNRK